MPSVVPSAPSAPPAPTVIKDNSYKAIKTEPLNKIKTQSIKSNSSKKV